MENNQQIVVTTQPVNKQLQVELKRAIAGIDKKLKQLAGEASYVFKASTNFKYNELDANTVNIQNPDCAITYLIRALAKMKRIEKEYNATMRELDIDTYPVCIWFGASTSAWIDDLTILVKRSSNKTTIAALTQKRQELVQFMSAEEKLTNILGDLKNLMK